METCATPVSDWVLRCAVEWIVVPGFWLGGVQGTHGSSLALWDGEGQFVDMMCCQAAEIREMGQGVRQTCK